MLVAIVGFFILAMFFTLKAHPQQGMDLTATVSAIQPTPTSTASPVVDVGATATELWYKENPLAQHPFTETVGPSPTATATPLARGIRPPACTFPLAQITPVESKPEKYVFSQPKILRNALPGNLYDSFGWMPDNQQIFVIEDLRGDYVQTNDNDIANTIYLYTPATGKVKVYANAVLKILEPLWSVSRSNAIVYPAMMFFDIDRKAGTYKLDRQIRVSYGTTDQDQILVHNLSELVLAVKPDGSTLIYLADKKILGWDQSLNAIPSVPFDLTHWDYATSKRNNQPVLYQTAWQPNSSNVLLYSAGYTGDGGYTFILDTDTGSICELEIDGWAKSARWSSDGRYLALHRSITYGYTDFPADMMIVLDTLTGKLSVVYFIPKEKKERFSIIDFAWAPDNRHLLALRQDVKSLPRLYLADFISGQSVNILPGSNLYATRPDTLAWSPDGSKLVFRCPTKLIDRICFVSVQRTGK